MTNLLCPDDGSQLAAGPSALVCPQCQRAIPVVDGVACFLPKTDDFYEGAYLNTINFLPRSERFWHIWPLWLINSGYLWDVRKNVAAGGVVVDLGCASGIAYFANRYSMIGCDLSLASLRGVQGYDLLVQADAGENLPLASGSVDAVVSSYFWEHLASDTKRNILRECHRVLRPGGKLIFLYDVQTENPLISKFRNKSPATYDRLFLEGDGHIGYISPQANAAIFEQLGFRMMQQKGMEKTHVQSPSTYEKLARFEGGRVLRLLSTFGRRPFVLPWTAFVRLVDALFSGVLPQRWSRIELTVAEKAAR